jgi:hypothetical protein
LLRSARPLIRIITTMKRTTTSVGLAGLVLGSALAVLSPASPASAAAPVAITGRASVLPGAVQAPSGGDSTDARVSGDGRYVIFSSTARLVPEDTDVSKDVYRKDLLTDDLVRVNPTYNGNSANSSSTAGAITYDGRYVAFWSWADNLVIGDTNGKADVFLRDLQKNTTERVSVSSSEAEGTGASPTDQDGTIDLSNDGRYVAFSSTAPNFGADADTLSDVFVRDRTAGTTELISVNDAEQSTDADSFHPSMSTNGRYVAFESAATNLVASDTNASVDAFVRDRTSGTTARVSLHDNDVQSPAGGFDPWIDDSGTNVVFASSSKLNGLDPNNQNDVYVRNRSMNTTTLASVGTDGWAAGLSQDPIISGDGQHVAYQSTSTKAMTGSNSWETIYSRRLSNGAMTRISSPTGGAVVGGASSHPSLSYDGTVAAFDSKSSALVTNDTGFKDVFFRRWVTLGPYTTTASFAQRQAADFLGSTSPANVTALDTKIRNGASVERTIADLANAPAFAGKRPALVRLYVAYFKRLPDLNGLNYWLNKLNTGTKLDKVSASFAASSEFKTKYGNTTNEQFVKLVYVNVFNRQPDPSGLAYWAKKLDQGMSRGTVLTNFSESSEGKRRLEGWVGATLLGLGMLDKLPTGNLLSDILDQGNGGSNSAEVRVILNSADYAATA